MANDINKCCAFTGHRPTKFPWKYDEQDKRCIELKAVLIEQIEKLAASDVTDFYSGMALGVDTWAAMAVLALKKENPALKLHCVLPCEGQADQWSAPARELYFSILDQADEVVYVSREYSEDCMLERNRYLVDHTTCLLAVYNGERQGGTAMTVRCAQRKKRKILIIDPVLCTIV